MPVTTGTNTIGHWRIFQAVANAGPITSQPAAGPANCAASPATSSSIVSESASSRMSRHPMGVRNASNMAASGATGLSRRAACVL
jgi:hypothetical protein